MSKSTAALVLIFVFSVLWACSPQPSAVMPETKKAPEAAAAPAAKAAGEVQWDKALAGARVEGKVSIYSALGPVVREQLGKGFKARYGLNVEWTQGMGSQLSQKIISEKNASLYLTDVVMTGSTQPVAVLKPRGVLDPLWPELILPEVTDTSKWLDNKLPWVDKDRYVISPGQAPSSNMLMNLNKMSPAEITSYKDLLNPKLKGRILTQNPVIPGTSTSRWWAVVGMEIMGEDFIRELARQDLVIINDQRIAVEWIVQDKYDISIAPQGETVSDFLNMGARNIRLITPKEGSNATGGMSPVAISQKRPHPNAARVFVNWVLGKEGQQVFVDYDLRQSLRLDIDIPGNFPPDKLRQTGIRYVYSDNEEFIIQHEKWLTTTLKEILSLYFK